MKINREARRLIVAASGVSSSTQRARNSIRTTRWPGRFTKSSPNTRSRRSYRILFGPDFALIAPDRRLKDFNEAGFKPEVQPLNLKQNAIHLLGLHTEEKKDAT